MEIPEFCTKSAPRVTRRRKTEAEIDPDFIPEQGVTATPGTSKDAGVAERKKVRRSQKLQEGRSKPPIQLEFTKREEYSIEDFRKKADESRRTRRITKTAKTLAENLKDVDQSQLADLEYPSDKIDAFGSKNPYKKYNADGDCTEDASDEEQVGLDFNNLPKCVMGSGRAGLPTEWEYSSLWNYELEDLTPDGDETDVDVKKQFPWKVDTSKPDVCPKLISVVGSFTTGCRLNLKKIAEHSRNVEYNPDRYAPLIMRIREPKSTGLIFRTGKVIVTGATTLEECKKASRKYARMIQKLGYQVQILNFDIQNILASCMLKFKVRLNQLAMNKLYGNLSYEPEIFPGLLIQLENPKVKIVVFCTGSVIMTGAKSKSDLNVAFTKVYPLLRMYAP